MNFYHNYLIKEKEAKSAREYLENRGFNETTLRTFRLGYAPKQGAALTNFLQGRGWKIPELALAGLALKGERHSTYYDRFRSRIIFPILDVRGRCIAFGGRIVGEGSPKYLNSSETPIFHKSSHLYGLFHAKSEMVRKEQAVVVEGYTDVLALYQAGIKYAVATLGTAFTSEHLRLLARFIEKVILVFDADVAGSAAAERGFGLLGEAKVDLYVVTLPAEMDPADFVMSRTKEEFEERLSQAKPLVDFCLDQAIAKYNLEETIGRVKAAQTALSLIASLPGPIAREEYLRKTSQKLNISYRSLLAELNKKRDNRRAEVLEILAKPGKLDAQGVAEREMIKLLIHYPDKAKEALEELQEQDFVNETNRYFFAVLKQFLQGKNKYEVADLFHKLEKEEQRKLLSELAFDNIEVEDIAKYFQDILRKLKEFRLQCQINKVKSTLEKLNPTKDPVGYDALFEQLLQLEAAKRDLKEKTL